MFYLGRFTERNPERSAFGEQHNGSVVLLPFFFAQVICIPQVLNKRGIAGNCPLHLLEAHTQSVPCAPDTRNTLRKLALDPLYLPFERLDSLVCLSGKFL